MRIAGQHYRSIWREPDSGEVKIIDQTRLPHLLEVRTIRDLEAGAEAIETMRVRGAPLIGITAAYSLAIECERDSRVEVIERAASRLLATRPTAINLRWALERQLRVARGTAARDRFERLLAEADAMGEEDVASCESIGSFGLEVLEKVSVERAARGSAVGPAAPLNILTHCNAGWLATVDWGTALAPIYKAVGSGLPLHVWVGETRPRNQGARLTAFELREMGVPHTVIVDNATGHLLQRGMVDVVIVGSDRTTVNGDVCNKVGTYLRALAARANNVPFYVSLPLSSVDWTISDGISEIPIEERSEDEVRLIEGLTKRREIESVELFAASSSAFNPAFDVTPSGYVTGLITDFGICKANHEELSDLRERSESIRV